MSATQPVTQLAWRKAKRSIGNGACVEVASFGGGIAVRDSKDPGGPMLTWSGAAWQEFLQAAKRGQFDVR